MTEHITEQMAKEMLQAKLTCMELEGLACIKKGCDMNCTECSYNYAQGTRGEHKKALSIAIKALEEIQQYRALGMTSKQVKQMQIDYCAKSTILEEYKALGTVEELRVARDKQVGKKPICKEMPYSEEVGFNDEWYCPVCNSYVGYFTEGMSEPEQMEYCNECGQHIARDWSEEEC